MWASLSPEVLGESRAVGVIQRLHLTVEDACHRLFVGREE
jgi:hypothetical protein